MVDTLSKNARRVQDYLRSEGYSFVVRELKQSTRTAQEAATGVGCAVSQIAKSLVFRDKGSDRPVLVVASGSNRVDLRKIKAKTGLALGKADGTFVKKKVGYAIGGVPPVGHDQPLLTLLDQDLKKEMTIWAAAGTPSSLFQLEPAALETLTNGRWLDLAERKKV